ncbi:MAG: ribonuclease H-like domain-containing protein [Planctomycetota bacterium]|jgi:hypothetical protein
MNKTEKILYYAETEDWTNRQIAEAVGCSMRLVQKRIGGTRERRGELQKDLQRKLPKILIFDIETSPMEFYGWALFKQQPTIAQVKKDWSVLCWSAKWLCGSEIMNACVSAKEAKNREDKSVITPMWDLLEEADVVVAHNGDRFDIRCLNGRFMVNGFGPNTPYRSIDTLKTSQRTFRHASHKLEWLCKVIGKRLKDPQGYKLWKQCIGKYGKKVATDALAIMQDYCDQDIRALEDLYMEIAPWIKSGPNSGVYVETDKPICPNVACGSLDLKYGGYYTTAVSKFRAFRCNSCGAIGRERKSVLSKAVRAGLVAPVAR